MRIRSPRRLTVPLCLALALSAALPIGGVAGAAPPRAAPPPARSSVLLELDTEAAAPAWRRATEQARRELRSPQAVQRAAAQAGHDQHARAGEALERLEHAVGPGVRILYRTKTLFTGLAVDAPADRLPALRALPGVRAVHPITRKDRSNAHSVPLTGAPAVWSGADAVPGNTGQGITIGIIDSGIDYTHADFGGPGTPEAFRAVDGSKPAPPGLFPNAKVTGGQDLVGDDYNPDPSAPDFQPVPHPDPNPLDCAAEGHGTHVAGTAAGYGVGSDGRTYTGPYRSGLDPAGFRVGPGAAPGAKLYALKIFGCHGGTDQLAHALDLAADPNQDGDLTDRLDVVNLSLGSRFGDPDDADALAVDKLAEAGTVVVTSAGNDGDVYGVGGSPGVAARALTVAASVGGHGDADGLRVLSPPAAAGLLPAHWSAGYRGWADHEVAAPLALPLDQADGCTPFSPADADRLRGRIALLSWRTEDADRACGSPARADHAADAGAVGAIFAADGDHLGEITGNARIPAAIVAPADGDRLRQDARTGETRVELATPGNPLHGSVSQDQPERVDTMTDFSSRGIAVAGLVKPDLAAPGETIWSAKAGSGSQGARDDGTSMAAPHISGIAALVRAAHPQWTVEQVKAALMDTAGDTWAKGGRTGPVYGPERAGAGRVRADLAVATPAVAYAVGERPGAVGLSFGPVPVTGPLALTREVEVHNFSTAPLDYTTGYQAATELPGARFELSPSRLTVPAGESARVRVTLSVPGLLERAPDPTLTLTQAGRARSYRGELSGRLLLTPADPAQPVLRVPLFAAPRPASDLTAAPGQAVPRANGPASTLLTLSGTAAVTGSGTASLISAFELGGEGPRWPDCPAPGHDATCVDRPGERAADLRAVGAATDAPAVPGDTLADGMLYLAATSWAPASGPVALTSVRASLDTDGDGVVDAVVSADRLPGSDVLVARTVDARTGRELDVQPLDARWGDTDTDLLDSDTVVLPVRLAKLPGLRPDAARIRYALWTGYQDGSLDPAGALSSIGFAGTRPTLEIDVLHPAVDVRAGASGPAAVVAPELPGAVLEVRRAQPGPVRLLLVHHLNTDGKRAQLLTVG
ncbi:subtilisin family serine protease [Kitasatospora sp. MAA4]|uniref:S8 family peptidase n=1 Tax=Kitasatospora sp. MAA4 TaxID=3035093 RepID=UPI002473ACDA|nr:S8 family serine peptidase [Kitasatospora sp. MAA4]MDH6133180.1 subtilisin family serine protease [Kitasatospora sp. MAA4]